MIRTLYLIALCALVTGAFSLNAEMGEKCQNAEMVMKQNRRPVMKMMLTSHKEGGENAEIAKDMHTRIMALRKAIAENNEAACEENLQEIKLRLEHISGSPQAPESNN